MTASMTTVDLITNLGQDVLESVTARGLCREPSGRPEDGLLRSRTGTCDIDRRRPVVGK